MIRKNHPWVFSPGGNDSAIWCHINESGICLSCVNHMNLEKLSGSTSLVGEEHYLTHSYNEGVTIEGNISL